MTAADDVLGRIGRFREAARMAVDSGAEVKDICLALLDLADMARAESDPVVARWSELAIWQEAAGFLGVDDEQPTFPPANFEQRTRRLRADGYTRCPTCLHDLPTDADLERWSRMRSARAEQLAARKGAVRP